MKFYDISEINGTGIARAIYTTADHPDWKYGKALAISNFRELGSQLGISPDRMTMANQTHTSVIRTVNALNGGELVTRPLNGVVRCTDTACKTDRSGVADLGLGNNDFGMGFDGLITNEQGLMLCTVEADCVPVYMLDPFRKAIGMVHSGWRGTAAGICAKAVKCMQEEYGTEPADIIAHIGPCICENCYEVGADLIDTFAEAFGMKTAMGFFSPRIISSCDGGSISDRCYGGTGSQFSRGTDSGTGSDKYNLNMRKAIRYTLIESGLRPEKISTESRCTFETEELCSWRRQRPVKTSMLTAIYLK